MRLSEVIDDKWDQERATRNRKPALKVQQAIAELDGWELELVPPKPMDTETGEVFHWTGTAVHQPDGNKVPVVIEAAPSAHSHWGAPPDEFKIKGDVHFNFGSASHRVSLDRSLEDIGQSFLAFYQQQLEGMFDAFRDNFIFSLDDVLPDLIDSVEEKDIPTHAKKDVYTPFITDWLSNPAGESSGLVNSRKFASELVSKIYKEWDDALTDRIEHFKDQAETDERDGRKRKAKDNWGGRG